MRGVVWLAPIIACSLAVAAPSRLMGQNAPVRAGANKANTQSTKDEPTKAQSTKGESTKGGAKNARTREPLAITPEREAAVATFVDRNHSELAPLLAHLRTSQPRQYEQAVREIFRVTERLAGIQERDPLLYELEVKLWTAQSRVQVLAARLSMDMTDSLKEELRAALAEQIAARLVVLKHQREQASQRLARMDRDIDQLEANQQTAIDRQLEMLSRTASGKNKNAPKKNAQNTGAQNTNARKKNTQNKNAPKKDTPLKTSPQTPAE